MKNIDELSLEESRLVAEIYEEATGALLNSLTELERKILQALPLEDTSGYRSAWNELNQELELLVNMRTAFKTGQIGIQPPTEPMVEKAQRLASELRQVDAKAGRIIQFLSLAQQVGNAYSDLHQA